MSSSQTWTEALELSKPARLRRARDGRRALLALLAGFLVLGLANQLGIATREVRAEGGGYTLSVRYARVARLGLSTPWEVRVTRRGGFDGPVTVTTTSSYFEIFDENGFEPDPSASTTEAGTTVWEFDPPDGDTLVISFDARLEPTYRGGRTATTAVRVGGRDVVSVTYRTRVMP